MATTHAPLTTTFTPPAGCFAPLTLTKPYETVDVNDDKTTILRYANATCLPSGYRGFPADDSYSTIYADPYSPGLVCPVGYSTASGTRTVLGTTIVRCCPSYVTFTIPVALTRAGDGELTEFGACSGFDHDDAYDYCASFGTTWTWWDLYFKTLSVGTSAAALYVSDIGLGWDESDLLSIILSPTETPWDGQIVTVVTPSSTSAKTATTEHATATADQTPHNQLLSTGATIGLSIGVGAATVLILSGAMHIFKQRRRRQLEGLDQQSDLREFFAKVKRKSRQVDTQGVHEIEGKAQAVEADDQNVRAELEGAWGGNELELPR